MTKWKILTSKQFDDKFKKLDNTVRKQIYRWIKSHLIDVDDPRTFGKPLQANLSGYWRYRIGNYRIIARIRNKELIVIFIDIGHRSDVY